MSIIHTIFVLLRYASSKPLLRQNTRESVTVASLFLTMIPFDLRYSLVALYVLRHTLPNV